MYKNVYHGTNDKHALFAVFLVVVLLSFYFILSKPSTIADIVVSMGFFAVLGYYNKKYSISAWAFLLVLLAILLHLLGSIGLYGYFVLSGTIGFDKLVHLVSSFAVAYMLLQISTEKKSFIRYGSVILIVLGLGSLVEINEFIGTRYFGINNGGIFAIGDSLPVKSDLQKYDTYFDMIFNLLGALVSVFFVVLGPFLRKV